MAKPPWARLTKPIRPMVTDSPTDTMNSTMPAARPPSSMLATSMPKITRDPAETACRAMARARFIAHPPAGWPGLMTEM